MERGIGYVEPHSAFKRLGMGKEPQFQIENKKDMT